MSTQIRFRTKIPAYRQRPGRSQALVTLTDAATRQRRDYWLGEFGSLESREAYHRTIAAWEANARRLPDDNTANVASAAGAIEVNDVIRDYWKWAEGYYRKGHLDVLASALGLVRKFYGTTPAAEFGPKKLRTLREEMIRGDARAVPPRQPWSRKYINAQIKRVRHMFKWAVAQELLSITVFQSLAAVEPLKRGRTTARENEKVGPVPLHLVRAVSRHLSRPVRALIRLQLLTGARPGELLGLRAIDIEMDRDCGVWTYRPAVHKNAYREQERAIYFGPRAQRILRCFMHNRPVPAFLFSPAEAEAERRVALHAQRATPLNQGNRPGTNRREAPGKKPGDRYTTNTYCRAIRSACEKVFPLPEPLRRRSREAFSQWQKRLTAEQKQQIKAWRKTHIWHPHQLRHNAATNLRREFGLEAAQVALGHASAQITDAVYAERDSAKVIEIMRKIG